LLTATKLAAVAVAFASSQSLFAVAVAVSAPFPGFIRLIRVQRFSQLALQRLFPLKSSAVEEAFEARVAAQRGP
jgi:hypothetical protein